MSDYSYELSVAKEAATSAAQIIEKYQDDNSFSVNFKGKNDLVTEADIKSEQEILSFIRKAFPDDHILAEETAHQATMPEGRTWLIDPIDGTTNFAHGFPIYCISIALWENGEPKMGLVLEVANGECFTATNGGGAFLNGDRIQVSKVKDLANSLVGTGFPYNDLSLMDNYLEFFRFLMHNTQGIRRPGSAAYDLCCVAAGRLDGFYEYALNPWDVAAGALIVQEAGGVVTDWSGGNDWLFGKRIVAGNPEVHNFLLEAIGNHFEEDERDVKRQR